MKRIAILTALLLAAVSSFGQAARVDIPLQTSGPNVPISGGPLPQALWVANAAAYLCTHPSATLAACQAAPITTYTDSTEGTTCPPATPLVQLPGNTCTAATGTTANVGFWYGGGVFDYWIVSSYGTYGPFSGNSSNSALPSSCGNPTGIPCGGTGATTAAGANLAITGVTQTGTLGTSSQVSAFPGTVQGATITDGTASLHAGSLTGAVNGTFSGTVAAGAATPTTIGSNGVLLNGVPALQAQTSLYNYYSGGAGNLTGTGNYNTANGFQALFSNTTGINNTANGYQALSANTTGINNTANGYQALSANTTGNSNTANGFRALLSNTTGYQNTANGVDALYSNTTGNSNSANGFAALFSNTTGFTNTANGYQALYANTTGSGNTANGYQALYFNTTGFSTTANGVNALYYNTTGFSNTANGFYALYYNTTGSSNTANGVNALYYNTTGFSNTANGYQALYANTTGSGNTANGVNAGQYIADGVTANQTSSNSVYEGFQAYPLASGDTNENVIGNAAIGHGSNTNTLGNTATIGTWLNGTQHLAATAPTASTGTVATYSTNAAGEITGLSAATAVTITFANSGWTNAAFCVANSSVTATQPYVTAISKTAVTFTSPALTGNLFYHCDGN